MEFHKSLYKSIDADNLSSIFNRKDRTKKNQTYGRSKRNELFQKNREIPLSPASLEESSHENGRKSIISRKSIGIKSKENVGAINANTTLSRQEAYVAKFLAWKKQKEIEKNQKLEKKRPFISACPRNVLFEVGQKSFAPENHKFKPPANLIKPTVTENPTYKIRNIIEKKPVEILNVKSNKGKNFVAINKKLASTPKPLHKLGPVFDSNAVKSKEQRKGPLFNLVGTPKEKIIIDKKDIQHSNKKLKMVTRSKNKATEIKTNNGKISKITNKIKPDAHHDIELDNMQNKRIKPTSKTKMQLKSSDDNAKKEITNVKKVLKKQTVSIKSPPKTNKTTVNKPFLVEKTPHKNPAYLKRENNSNTKNKKIKDSVKSSKTINQKGNKNEGKTEMQAPKFTLFEKPKIVVTKEDTYENTETLNVPFITSTQKKNSSNLVEILPPELGESMLSPIENKVDEKETKNFVPLIDIYIRRSSVNQSNPKLEDDALIKSIEVIDLDKTPMNLNDENEPINYVSPYVTLSRGKGNRKREKILRDSIYVLDDSIDGIMSAEMRRVKETARYFRKMLNDETNRLIQRCGEWEQYVKDTEFDLLENCGGNDMINVALGQTKLLTSSKFQQFKKLIEQCEEYAHSKYESKDIDEKILQKILPEDLEGFWQMMYIQVDNIDERFRRLERWRSNEWKDPDEKTEDQPQEKKKNKNKLLSKVSKKKLPTASTALVKHLKEMYMTHMKNKNQELAQEKNEPIIILSPSRKSKKSLNTNDDSNTTPLRRSKRFSTALTPQFEFNQTCTPSRKSLRIEATVNSATKILQDSIGTPNHNISKFRLISLMKTPCIACPGDVSCSPMPRKSILKTPGTQKKKQTVIFNEELQIESSDFQQSRKLRRRRL